MTIQTINPANGEPLATYEVANEETIMAALADGQSAFEAWRQDSFERRAQVLMAAAAQLRQDKQRLAELMTLEMGKAISESLAEVEKCAWVCEHYARYAQDYLAPRQVPTDARLSMVRHDPLGIILAVMPWNFPLWQVFRFAAPTLMAGNVGLLKHASNVPGCAAAITEVFLRAGAPKGVFNHLVLENKQVELLMADARVKGVSLTGSVRAGRAVAALAGQHCKPSLLELGGSDPFIVLEDADLEQAARIGAKARFINNGQSCIAAKRHIVVKARYDEFIARFSQEIQALKLGDPMSADTQLGPMARPDLRDELHDQVMRSVEAGAKLVFGGELLAGQGAYYPPTLLVDVRPGMATFDEEVFGPVASVICAADEDEAIALANQSEFGLGASLWTADMARALALVPKIEAGAVAVNGMVKSDPRLPFGGVKDSGFGRELSVEGILAFVNTKAVWMG